MVHVHDGAELVMGRATGELAIDHESVSRRHAVIRRTEQSVTIEDLGSRNGTLVNGARIDGTRRLAAGDVIKVGPATAVVARASPIRRGRQVASVIELEARLEAEVERAVRYHRPLALVMLRYEGPEQAIAMHVERLANQLRRMDLVAEYAGDELALVLPETDRAAADLVTERACAAGAGVHAYSGVATLPGDGSHAGELIGHARDLLRGTRTPRRRAVTSVTRVLGAHIVVADPQMQHVYALAKRVAPTPITVLVLGETGTGKEVVAEAVHRFSPRADKPYVRLNCAALPASLAEAELFGYEKGAFTGATARKLGYFEAANGGTLFLDELGELPLETQSKLLRAIETRRIVRVGATSETAVDVRLVCATHRDLEADAKRGRFREDLYFRISAFVIPVPPLRDRRAEIPLLASHFARELSAEVSDRTSVLSREALALLSAHDWPGNVRELRNVIERAVVLSEQGRIEPSHLPDHLQSAAPSERRVVDLEQATVAAALDAHGGNQTHAARQLGISRFALIRLMDKYQLKRGAK